MHSILFDEQGRLIVLLDLKMSPESMTEESDGEIGLIESTSIPREWNGVKVHYFALACKQGHIHMYDQTGRELIDG